MSTYGKAYIFDAALSGGTNASSGTLYSCPANRFGIVQLSVSSAGATAHPRFYLDGRIIWKGPTLSTGAGFVFSGALVVTQQMTVYVGPGQALTFDTNGGLHSVFITGVQYKNS